MLLNILICLAVVLVALIVVIASRPSSFRYSRSLLIAAPPEVLFEQVNDLRKFQDWNPWAKVDPSAVITYAGPATGVDSAYTWSGNKEVGEGTMTIIETQSGSLVRARMDFRKPFAAVNLVDFTFVPEGNQTLVTWSMYGPSPFIGKAIGFFIDCDKMCGGQFTKGLQTLKSLTEKPVINPVPSSTPL